MLSCIGKLKDHGKIVSCTNVSEIPTNPERPEWGYLCSECANVRYGRQQLKLDLPDHDKPNAREFEPYEMYHSGRAGMKSPDDDMSEQEEMDTLQELEI